MNEPMELSLHEVFLIAQALEVYATLGQTADGKDELTPQGKRHVLALQEQFQALYDAVDEEDEDHISYRLERIERAGKEEEA